MLPVKKYSVNFFWIESNIYMKRRPNDENI
jgi:hypothetical protein